MAVLFDPHFQAIDANGLPMAGATLGFYRAGTTTKITVYQDGGATTPHANPVVADSTGTFPAVFISGVSTYKIILKTVAGITVSTIDNIAADAGGIQNSYGNISDAQSSHPNNAPDYIRTAGYSAPGDLGGALYKLVASEPSHAGKFSIALADGVTVVWYEIAETELNERMFGASCDGDWAGGGVDATAVLQDWASCPVSNRKRFTGVNRATDTIEFPIDTIFASNDGHNCGIDFIGVTAFTGPSGILLDGSSGLVNLTDLASDVVKGQVDIDVVDASDVVHGDYLCIYNPTDWSWVSAPNAAGGRSSYHAGEWVRVMAVTGNSLKIYGGLWADYAAADVDVYRLRSGSPQLADFRVNMPFLEVAAIKVDSAIAPRLVNLRADGSSYAGVQLTRCIEPYVNCHLFQLEDLATPGTEYALSMSSCYGGEVHGSYSSSRHGISIGNGTFACNVPNRNIKVFADTNSYGTSASLDFGHGCSENLTAIGGTHDGLVLGGKNMRMIGCRFRSSPAGLGIVVSGSEFVEGDFVFDACIFDGLAPTTGSQNTPMSLPVQAAITGPVRFIFTDCVYNVDPGSAQVMRVTLTGTAYKVSVIVDGALVEGGAGLTGFLYMRDTGGAHWGLISMTGIKGLGASVPPVFDAGGTMVVDRWQFDRQSGSASIAGVTSTNAALTALVYPWPYPVGVVPELMAQMNGSNIGGARCFVIAAAPTNTGCNLTALTPTAVNFASTASGNVRWQANVG